MASQVKVTSHKDEVLEELQRKVKLVLDTLGSTAEEYAKGDCPVDTGRLRNSIAYAVRDDAVYIGTNVEYAEQIEFNDHMKHTTGKAHYLRDSVTTHDDEYKDIAEQILKE